MDGLTDLDVLEVAARGAVKGDAQGGAYPGLPQELLGPLGVVLVTANAGVAKDPGGDGGVGDPADTAQDELEAYTLDLIADRRNKPADDLITSLIAAEEAGDNIYNGAIDNATGVAGVLEIAEGFTVQPRPARSLVFLLGESSHPPPWDGLSIFPPDQAACADSLLLFNIFRAAKELIPFFSCDAGLYELPVVR
mgnify:CR=1 FL=1